MTFGKNSATRVGERHCDRAAILESKNEGRTNEIGHVLLCRQIDRALDPMTSRNRHAVPRERLVSRDLVAHLLQPLTAAAQVSYPRMLLDKSHPDRILPHFGHNLRVRPIILVLITVLCFESQSVSAQAKTADQGVYTSAQAARGATVFEAHCVSCHREGGTAPVLAGARFTKSFADATLLSVFTTIQTTMPRNAPNSLSEAEYVDTVAHLLRLNGYPDGMTELAVARLGDIKVPGQGGSLDFTLVHVVGCLAQAGRVWTLGKATDPVRTRAPEVATDAEAAELDQTPLGNRSFRLQQVYGAPAGWMGQKVATKGFLTRSGAEERVNVTSMRVLSTPCPN